MAPFYGWGPTVSNGSTGSVATTRRKFIFYHSFPRSSWYSIDGLRRMKGWLDLGATEWFTTREPWIGNPVPKPIGASCRPGLFNC